MCMTIQRTSIVLDDDSRQAAHDLAAHYRCSMAEAIRRAIVRHRDVVHGVPPARRAERTQALLELADLFEEHDAEGEIERLKESDEFS